MRNLILTLTLTLLFTACGESEPAASPAAAEPAAAEPATAAKPAAKPAPKVELDLKANADGGSIGIKTEKVDIAVEGETKKK